MFTETVEGVDKGLTRLLEAVRSGELPVARLKDLIAASRSWEAKVSALQTDAARSISLREGHGDGGASVLRDQAGKSKFQARRSLGAAEVLDEMPGLRSAVDAGEVPLANAERLADAAKLTDPEAVDSAADLLAQAKELPPDQFAREASAWTQRHQPDHGHEDYLQKRRRRYLKTWKQQDGMVRLDGLLDPETGTRICSRLQSAAEALHRQDQQSARAGRDSDVGTGPTHGQGSASGAGSEGVDGPRSWDQLRADALDLLTSDAADESTGGGSGGRPKRCHHNIHDHNWRVTHRRGKPALEPPDPLRPPGPTDGRHPHDARDARRQPPAKASTTPAPNRQAPPRQRAPALFDP